MTIPTDPTRTANCQECGETGEGCDRPWTNHRGTTYTPHTCYPCHDRMDAEADAAEDARKAAREQATEDAEYTKYWYARGIDPAQY